MAKLFTPRPRANTTNDTISQPTLEFTDAAPRSDLRPVAKRSQTYGPDRPRRHDKAYYAVPPHSPIVEESSHDDKLIGVALGSPSAAWPSPSGGRVVARAAPDVIVPELDQDVPSNDIKRKPSKWKKFGDLFKAKNAPEAREDNAVYHVQINGHSLDSPSNTPPDFQSKVSNWPQSNSKRGKRKTHAKLVKDAGPPAPQRHWGEWSEEPADGDRRHLMHADPSSNPSPILNVEIPEVEMERYSVMFGSLLGKQRSSTLLARRSRTLDKLETHGDNNIEHDYKPPRRATSPGPGKSPVFTLFPAASAPKTPKGADPRRPALGVSPLQKSNTLPSSPQKPSFTSPPWPTRSESREKQATHARWDSEASHVSTKVSDTEYSPQDTNPQPRHDLASVTDQKEPVWEMVRNPSQSSKAQNSRHRMHRDRKQSRSPDSSSSSSSSSPQQSSRQQNGSSPRPPRDEGLNPSPLPKPTREPPALPQPKDSPVSSTSSSPRPPFPPRSSSNKHPQIRISPNVSDSTASPLSAISASDSFNDRSPESPIEVSIARSISVSKGQKNHLLVPVSNGGGRTPLRRTASDHPDAARGTNDERVVAEKRVGTPTLHAVQKGHMHHKSQNAVIETV